MRDNASRTGFRNAVFQCLKICRTLENVQEEKTASSVFVRLTLQDDFGMTDVCSTV